MTIDAWVIRSGTTKGEGDYLDTSREIPSWISKQKDATRFPTREDAQARAVYVMRALHTFSMEARIVCLKPRLSRLSDWEKMQIVIDDHAAKIARVEKTLLDLVDVLEKGGKLPWTSQESTKPSF